MERIQESEINNDKGRYSIGVNVIKALQELLRSGRLLAERFEFVEVNIDEDKKYMAFLIIPVDGVFYTVQIFSGEKKLDKSTHLGKIHPT